MRLGGRLRRGRRWYGGRYEDGMEDDMEDDMD